ILVRLAREGRCKGVLLDPEHYDYECELFSYRDHAAQRSARSFSEYETVARLRGRQLMQAAAEIFPGITIACLYGYTLAENDARYALLPAFLDGMLEGADAKAKFIDLGEGTAGCKTRAQFIAAQRAVSDDGIRLSARPGLYAEKVSAGFALAIDRESAR